MKTCAICKARFKPLKNAITTETRHLCSKCRKAGQTVTQTLIDALVKLKTMFDVYTDQAGDFDTAFVVDALRKAKD